MVSTASINLLKTSSVPIAIGSNLQPNGRMGTLGNFSIKEAMLYDRALTDNEVKTITEGFEKNIYK